MDLQPLNGKAAQSVALASRRFNVWEGSVRSGKTVASILAWARAVLAMPASTVHLLAGRTHTSAYRNVAEPLLSMPGVGRVCHYNAGDKTLRIGGRTVYIVGGATVQAPGRIRGLTLGTAYVDEATLVTADFWRMLTSRLSVEGARLFATTNPDSPTHWLHENYLKRASAWLRMDGTLQESAGGLDLIRFSFNLNDNPTLDPEYVKGVIAEYHGVWRRRFVDGEWVAGEGVIYDMFDPARHVKTPMVSPEALPVVAMDYGTLHPFVALYMWVTPSTEDRLGLVVPGRVHVADEWVYDSTLEGRQLTDSEYHARLRRWLGDRPVDYTFLDPAAASMSTELVSGQWPAVWDANNDVADGIRYVSSLLGNDRLTISPRCKRLIPALGRYAWDEKSKEREQPVKDKDDEADALRYGVASSEHLWRRWG